jgi:lipoyl(octanoyl) transferase
LGAGDDNLKLDGDVLDSFIDLGTGTNQLSFSKGALQTSIVMGDGSLNQIKLGDQPNSISLKGGASLTLTGGSTADHIELGKASLSGLLDGGGGFDSISTTSNQETGSMIIQRHTHEQVSAGLMANTLIFVEHPSVYTAGKRTLENERPVNGTPVIDVDRGGKITWHGPGQIVGYPILRLAKPTELVGFVREIESALIETCEEFGLKVQRIKGRSGVWTQDDLTPRKIAAIGIRVAKATTMHGFALNVNPDLASFTQIIPCGIADAEVTSMAQELKREITAEEVLPVLERHITSTLAKVSA